MDCSSSLNNVRFYEDRNNDYNNPHINPLKRKEVEQEPSESMKRRKIECNPSKNTKSEEKVGFHSIVGQSLIIHQFNDGNRLFKFIKKNSINRRLDINILEKIAPTEMREISFSTGNSVSLPLCLWSVHSEVLKAQLLSSMKSKPILQNDFPQEIIQNFIDCLKNCSSYGILCPENVQQLKELADKYQVMWLKEECDEFFCEYCIPLTAVEQKSSRMLKAFITHSFFDQMKLSKYIITLLEVLAHSENLMDLQLFVWKQMDPFLEISKVDDWIQIQLNDYLLENYFEKLKTCLSMRNGWHSTKIKLSINDLTKEKIQPLQQILQKCPSLDFLEVNCSSNTIDDLRKVILENHQLVYLDIQADLIWVNSMVALIKSNSQLKFMTITLENRIEESDFEEISSDIEEESSDIVEKFNKLLPILNEAFASNTTLDSIELRFKYDACSPHFESHRISRNMDEN